MTKLTESRIPQHLRRYIVDQCYERYTPEDQAVWRFIMRQLKSYLSEHAHPAYVEGLQKSGLEVDRIPHIATIDSNLEKFGWGAVPVSGFIPPAAFMEFQAIGVLPIASDMRTIGHLLYTPAPDIVHEAAGHAPILIEAEYGAYLRQYGEVARHAIASREDLAQYEAIRVLSDLKEDPQSTPEQVAEAERNLVRANQQMRFVSETALLSRMNWWTAEYGLIGKTSAPKIFGAGLLSSVGEARTCFDSSVQKIPLSLDCVNFSYDITEPQPQLFVASDFAQLGEVLEELASTLAYRRGGVYGLDRAVEAETVTTTVFDSGAQISGRLKNYVKDAAGEPAYLVFEGPTQLSFQNQEISDQGCSQHTQGFSCPVGLLKGAEHGLHLMSSAELARLGLKIGEVTELEFSSGVRVKGRVKSVYQNLIITWTECTVTLADKLLFDPSWGEYDMAMGTAVVSVFGGPADRIRYQSQSDYVAKKIPPRVYTQLERSMHEIFSELRTLREKAQTSGDKSALIDDFYALKARIEKFSGRNWLQTMELLEICYLLNMPASTAQDLKQDLQRFVGAETVNTIAIASCVQSGMRLAQVPL